MHSCKKQWNSFPILSRHTEHILFSNDTTGGSHLPVSRQSLWLLINTLRPRQNGRHFADDTFKRIFLKENVRISIKISLKFVPKSPIDNIPSLFQIMACCWAGNKPLSEAMMVSLLRHICVARPRWVKCFFVKAFRWLGTFTISRYLLCPKSDLTAL